MNRYSVQEVTEDDRTEMIEFLESVDEPVTVNTILEETAEFDDKQRTVSTLQALMNDHIVSHNVAREYYLI